MGVMTGDTTDPAEAAVNPVVERTFLFSDIEGSTPLWERDAAAMSKALVRHDAIVRLAVADQGGHVFKHTGDGIVAVFDRSVAGVRAAVAMQRALHSEPWEPGMALRIRAGVHHGQAEQRGSDYFGRTMNLAARIMDAAKGNQVLISGTLLDRLGVEEAFELRPEGLCTLKGIHKPVELHTVVIEGMDQNFPPVNAPVEIATNIPVVLTDLIGRHNELDQVCSAVADHRLVTLTGAPGTGKTRLAIEAATRLVADHPGGVHVVELAGVLAATDVEAAIAARVLGVEPIADAGSAVERLAATISEPTLLVLDNCEHHIEAVADFVLDVLSSSEAARFLLTSREALLVGGEQVVTVEPLGLGASGAATQLFMQRARAARSDLTGLDLDTIDRLCERLDGLPLAIELAAARLDVLSLQQLDERLFEVLGSSRRRGRRQSDRHATIEAAVRWSWELLDDDERRVLTRASVFVGSFDLDAASRVCGGDDFDPIEILDLISSLQDRSFISSVWEESGNRFRLLEVVRSFAAAHLHGDELDVTRRRHQDYYLVVSSQLAGLFDQKPDTTVIAQLELDDANFVAALGYTEGGGALRTARKLAMNLHTYWEETGRLLVGYEQSRVLMEPPEPTSSLWRSVIGLNVTYAAMTGRLDSMADDEETLGDLVSGPPDIGSVNGYFALGFAGLARGDMVNACTWFDTAADVVAPFDGGSQRQALMTAGACLAYAGDAAAALDRYAAARAVPPPEQGWFNDYANVFESSATVQADPAAGADDLCDRMENSLGNLVDQGLGFRVTVAAHQAAYAFALANEHSRFDTWARVATEMARQNGHRWGVVVGVELAAWSAAWRGDDGRAITHWAVVDDAVAQSGYRLPPVHQEISQRLRAEVLERTVEVDWDSAAARVASIGLSVYVDEL